MIDDFNWREKIEVLWVFALLAELRIWLELLQAWPGPCELVDQYLESCGLLSVQGLLMPRAVACAIELFTLEGIVSIAPVETGESVDLVTVPNMAQ
jgi:hypothetical protein